MRRQQQRQHAHGAAASQRLQQVLLLHQQHLAAAAGLQQQPQLLLLLLAASSLLLCHARHAGALGLSKWSWWMQLLLLPEGSVADWSCWGGFEGGQGYRRGWVLVMGCSGSCCAGVA
jgi:hypothetical protein